MKIPHPTFMICVLFCILNFKTFYIKKNQRIQGERDVGADKVPAII